MQNQKHVSITVIDLIFLLKFYRSIKFILQQSRPQKDITNKEKFDSSTSQQRKEKGKKKGIQQLSVQVYYYKMEDEKLQIFELLVIQANIDFLWRH